jgi:class 3 adenylate cyclase/tetratricopeptide (TPR) repeat protein
VDFVAVVDQVIALLRQRGRVAYRTLKRQFQLDDEALEDLKIELIDSQRLATDEQGTVLVWTGAGAIPPAAPVGLSGTVGARPPLAYTPPYLAEKILTSRTALEGERKLVTVLFADLKGSMELLADRDPEEARQLLDPVLERMMDAVHRYEGTVNQVMGDGIMALFGAPLAHEDHAVRACYAALAMQAAVKQYAAEVQRSHGVPVQIRVGLNAGEVVVRAIGSDLHMDYTAVGQTTHLAARMEQMAMPGSILLTQAVLRLAEGYVQVTPLGPVSVKGLAAPVEVFELVGASGIRRRLQATAARGLTRFVGRDTEFAALVQALERAGTGQGQVVAVVGEAGVGKSRLVYECIHSHHTQGWQVLESMSVSYGKATPYFPVLDLLRRYAHVDDSDDARTIRAKVTGQLLTLDEALQDAIPPLLALLDALPDGSPFLALDPPQRRQRTLTALKRVFLRESQVQPVLVVFEDLHWIDTETQALLDSLVESLPTARLLLLVNYRPEYQHGWGSKTYYTQLRLDPLPPASADALLQALLGDAPGLETLKPLLIARTAGNPLFLEESVRTLVETGGLVGERGAYRLTQALATLQVPATVQAVLTARIDRLPPEEKRLLQTAAVIGTEVPLALLQALAEGTDEVLRVGLAHLQAAEFLYETRLFPDLAYTFKHALTHEVAYGSLLQERRRTLHASIVETLERLAPERVAEQVDLLAHHAWRGEVWDKAVAYGRQAGIRAMARSAYREAVTAFEQTLVALEHLPESRARQEQVIDIRLDLRSALLPLGEEARIVEHISAAAPLAEALGDLYRLGLISYNLCYSFAAMGDYERTIAAGQRALAQATASDAVDLQIMIQSRMGLVYYGAGDFREALTISRQVIASLEGKTVPARFGLLAPSSVVSRILLSLCLADMGAFAEGMVVAEAAVQMAEAVEQPYSLVVALHDVGTLYRRQGDLSHAIPVLQRSLTLCQETNIPLWVPLIASTLGVAYALSGRTPEALPLLTQTIEHVAAGRHGGDHGGTRSRTLAELSEGLLLVGRVEDASALAEQLLTLSRTHPGRGHQAHVCRLLGDIARHRDPPQSEPAAAHYQQALVLAEALGMRPLQAHCYRGLGLLYALAGQREQARAALSAAIALYRAMDMTFWLPQTEAALAYGGKCDG